MNSLRSGCVLLAVLLQTAAAELQEPISGGHYQRQVFADNFSAPALSKLWKLYASSSEVRDGFLVGIQKPNIKHAAVHNINLEPLGDVELSVDLRFAGSKMTNLTFNQDQFEETHAGHICRIVVSPTQVILRDDKTGMFKNEIYEMSKAGGLDDATKELLKTKEVRVPVNLESNRWYTFCIRIQGDRMQTFIDGKLIGTLRSEGLAHAAKDRIGLVTPDREMHYDNIVVKAP
jgi:hypothetical protein